MIFHYDVSPCLISHPSFALTMFFLFLFLPCLSFLLLGRVRNKIFLRAQKTYARARSQKWPEMASFLGKNYGNQGPKSTI